MRVPDPTSPTRLRRATIRARAEPRVSSRRVATAASAPLAVATMRHSISWLRRRVTQSNYPETRARKQVVVCASIRGCAMTTTKAARVREQVGHPIIDADGHFVELGPAPGRRGVSYLEEVGGAELRDRYLRERRSCRSTRPRCSPTGRSQPCVTSGGRCRRGGAGRPATSATGRPRTSPRCCYERLDEIGHRLHDPVPVDEPRRSSTCPTASSSAVLCRAVNRLPRPQSSRRTRDRMHGRRARPDARRRRRDRRARPRGRASSGCDSGAHRGLRRGGRVVDGVDGPVPPRHVRARQRLRLRPVLGRAASSSAWRRSPTARCSTTASPARSRTTSTTTSAGSPPATSRCASRCSSAASPAGSPICASASSRAASRGRAACSPTSSATGRSATRTRSTTSTPPTSTSTRSWPYFAAVRRRPTCRRRPRPICATTSRRPAARPGRSSTSSPRSSIEKHRGPRATASCRRFYFGCEADDPLITVGVRRDDVNPLGARLRPVFGSDISHWDVRRHDRADRGGVRARRARISSTSATSASSRS